MLEIVIKNKFKSLFFEYTNLFQANDVFGMHKFGSSLLSLLLRKMIINLFFLVYIFKNTMLVFQFELYVDHRSKSELNNNYNASTSE